VRIDPKSSKKTDNLTVDFLLLGLARLKAARRMLMKLTPRLVCFKNEFASLLIYMCSNK